jgi:hypothetical protein
MHDQLHAGFAAGFDVAESIMRYDVGSPIRASLPVRRAIPDRAVAVTGRGGVALAPSC